MERKSGVHLLSPQEIFGVRGTGEQRYADLNIPIGPRSKDVCERAIECYKLLALNTPVVATTCLSQKSTPGGGSAKKGKKRKLEERTGGTLAATAGQTGHGGVPPLKDVEWIRELMEKYTDVRILQRLTVIFYDVNHLQSVLSQENVSSYDIIAVVPTNHEAMVSCIISTTLIFDIITFDLEGPHWIGRVKLNRQKGKVAADKDVYFEITYAPSLHGDEPCENMIYIANRLTEDICTRKLKNIIVSSGAATSGELRSPKDVLGIGYLMGLDETTTRICIREHAGRIFTKTGLRKFGKSWVAFVPDKVNS